MALPRRAFATIALVAVVMMGGLFAGREALSSLRREGPQIYVLSSLATVRPRGTEVHERFARIEAARGEWESFQVLVRAGTSDFSSLTVHGEALVGPGGARIEQHLFRVAFVDVRVPSNVEGAVGPWPDPLIPDVDLLVGEKRSAFPVDVPAGSDLTTWVDVFVPHDAPAGIYRGAVFVDGGAAFRGRAAVTLMVHRFELPATSSLPVTFGFSSATCARGHEASADPKELTRLYALSALRNRISLHGGSFDPPDCAIANSVQAPGTIGATTSTARLDSDAYDREVGPFLDGKADPGGPADSARWTAFDLRLPLSPVAPNAAACLRALARHLDDRGWFDRVFDYTADEPDDAALAAVLSRAWFIDATVPGLPRLVTRPATSALDGAVDIWCPPINLVDAKPGAPDFGAKPVARGAYAERLLRGQRLWWYQSCLSHGCDIVGGEAFSGWPSLVIDAPPVAHRIFEWLSFRYDMGGELYYNTVEDYAGGDPFHDFRRHGGNGDGTLYYPGRVDLIGGHTPIPLESIRIKRIRDGLEDYEYLTLLARRAGRPTAERYARSVAERTFSWEHDPARLLSVRSEIARHLDALTP